MMPSGGIISDEDAAKLCLLAHEIAWYAMDVALRCEKDTSRSWSREQICRTVLKEVNKVLGGDHNFGRNLLMNKEFAACACLADISENEESIDY